MKTTQEVEVTLCDFCGNKMGLRQSCTGCDKDICLPCSQKSARKYHGDLDGTGPWDGLYCSHCHTELKDDPLHRAYETIVLLIRERDEFDREFQRRADDARVEVQRQLKLRNNGKGS